MGPETKLAVTPYQLPGPPDAPLPSALSTSEYLRLWTAFINSEMHPGTFLKKIQYPNPNNSLLTRRLAFDLRDHLDSYSSINETPDVLLKTARAQLGEDNPDFNLRFNEIINTDFASLLTIPGQTNSTSLSVNPALTQTEQIVLWRSQQAFSDWSAAQAVKNKALEMLQRMTPETFRASDLRSISATLLDAQRQQRKALGLPDESVGVTLDGIGDDGANLPIINVTIKELPAATVEANVTENN